MSNNRRYFTTLLSEHVDAPYDPKKRGFIESVASGLYDRHEAFSRWPESVQFFYACYDINYQVGNGGFAQVAYNAPELLPIAERAFKQFGRAEAAALCGRAVAQLPAEAAEHLSKGLVDNATLTEVFDHFNESAMAELDENIPDEFWADDELQLLVQQHREDFAAVDEIL